MEDSSTDDDVFFGLQEVQLPLWLKENPLCNVDDWKAFIKERFSGTTTRHDWFYAHRRFKKKFRSKPEVESFLRWLSENATTLENATTFEGRKLQEKRTLDHDDAESSGTTTRSSKAICTRGSGSGRGRGRGSGSRGRGRGRRGRGMGPWPAAYRPMLREMDKLPPGFI